MASCTDNIDSVSQNSPQNNKFDMSNLRDRGLEYVSSTGRLIPAKSQPGSFCFCPQRCSKNQPREKWAELFNQFYGLADQAKQNAFLRTHIQIKKLALKEGEEHTKHKRRVTCKYKIPILQEGETIEKYLDKLSDNSIEVCQKAFMNVLAVTEKRVRQQREANITGAENVYDKRPRPSAEEVQDQEFKEWFENYRMPANLTISASVKRKHEEVVGEDQPLDLSSHTERRPTIPIDINKDKLYELAAMLGLPKNTVTQDVIEKYEALVRKNLQKGLPKKQKKALSPSLPQPAQTARPMPALTKLTTKHIIKDISGQMEGLQELQDYVASHTSQAVNNGDLTITPVTSTAQSVVNYDIMQVNNFFQNQLWTPELIGLPGQMEFV